MLKKTIKNMTLKDWAVVALTLNLVLAVVNLVAGNYTACIASSTAATILSGTLNV